MKCSACNSEIENEYEMVLLNQDGDFACDKKCEARYEKEKAEFFANIHDDKWYNEYLNGKS